VRSNVFLHFLNRDSREIYGLFDTHYGNIHPRLLSRAMNAAAILCEDHCFAPPGFILEDEIAFRWAEVYKEFLESALIQFPLRETSLSDYAEKKRSDYMPMRDRYSGLFSDRRLHFLGENAKGLIRRKSHITEGILNGWEGDAERGRKIWQPVKKILQAKDIDQLTGIPGILNDEGTALTWAAISPRLSPAALEARRELRGALQHTYFSQYCSEYKLVSIARLPYMIDDFSLPRKARSFCFERLRTFLDSFSLWGLLIDAPASMLVALRKKPGFIAFIDAYVALAETADSLLTLRFHAARAAARSTFNWSDFAARFNAVFNLPGDIELVELADAMGDVAQSIVVQHGLPSRPAVSSTLPTLPQPSTRVATVTTQASADLALFVALNEELEELAKQLGFQRNHVPPYATGKLGEHYVEVICSKGMGRVRAAIEVTRYLEKRRQAKPKMILIVGLAGGFAEKKVIQGHLVCVEKVVDLASRKILDDAAGATDSKFRQRDYALTGALAALLQSDSFPKNDWIGAAIEKADWPADRRPSIDYGEMASADEVVASDEWRKTLLGHADKLLGVEMEAGGVCAAAEAFNVKVGMLRVISDVADPSKGDDAWRKIGMRTIAEMLRFLPIDKLFEALE